MQLRRGLLAGVKLDPGSYVSVQGLLAGVELAKPWLAHYAGQQPSSKEGVYTTKNKKLGILNWRVRLHMMNMPMFGSKLLMALCQI